jgi:hypothetical protein
MSTGYLWVLARNAGDRVRAQHAVDGRNDGRTACGWPVVGWSRDYTTEPLPVISCKTCRRITGAQISRRPHLALVS